MASATPNYQRVLLKISGEALGGERRQGLDADTLHFICMEVAAVVALDVQVAIVVGGGNYFRGAKAGNLSMERASADYIGMLATVMNAIALQQAFLAAGVQARVQSAIPMPPVAEPYIRERALKHLNRHSVVIMAAGTGSPYFTTDTAASLRAIEIGADLLLKATQVDGVYDRDPNCYENASRFDTVSYDEVLHARLDVMDATAIALCREHGIPLCVFDIKNPGCLYRIILGDNKEGTLVHGEVT